MPAGRPRVHNDRLQEILDLRAKGYTLRAIALALNVTKSTIHRMLKRPA